MTASFARAIAAVTGACLIAFGASAQTATVEEEVEAERTPSGELIAKPEAPPEPEAESSVSKSVDDSLKAADEDLKASEEALKEVKTE